MAQKRPRLLHGRSRDRTNPVIQQTPISPLPFMPVTLKTGEEREGRGKERRREGGEEKGRKERIEEERQGERKEERKGEGKRRGEGR